MRRDCGLALEHTAPGVRDEPGRKGCLAVPPNRDYGALMRNYAEAELQIAAVLDGEPNLTARLATVSCILHNMFDEFFWTGFYMVDPDKPDELVVGPYQGTLGCLRIAFGRGVCGTAAQTRQTQIVRDVHVFPGHIACDPNSQSEIVVPVFDGETLIGVMDIDSAAIGTFDQSDADALERIAAMITAS